VYHPVIRIILACTRKEKKIVVAIDCVEMKGGKKFPPPTKYLFHPPPVAENVQTARMW
jgi:hypothetical protein